MVICIIFDFMRSLIILLTAAFIFSLPLAGQENYPPSFEDTVAVYEDLFEIKEPLYLTLKFDKKEFQKTKMKEPYLSAEMTCHVTDSFQVKHDVRIRARGEIRKTICITPPFWLNIRQSGIGAEDLRDVTKMKVVTRCKSSKSHEDYVLKEYLIYQIWNLLSPYSFNTRLVRLKFIDTGRDNKESEDWAFIIEPEDMMAERNNCMSIKNDRLSLRTVNKEWMDKAAFFCYMIGQADFSVTGRHNLKILTSKDYGPSGFIPVPYDFDYCGLVDAEYATPGENLGLESVTERYFLGACRSEETYLETIEWLASFREEIENLILTFEYMDESSKVEMLNYIASYYDQTENKSFLERQIISTCR